MNLSLRYVLHLIRSHLNRLASHGLGLARHELADLFKPKIQSPFDGWPKTRQSTDKHGNPRFRVRASLLTPERAKLGDELGTLTTVLIVGAAVIYALYHNPSYLTLFLAICPWLLRSLIERFWRDFFRRPIVMELTPDQFRVRHSLLWTRYDRTLQHRFALYAHDKTRQEHLDTEFKVRKAEMRRRVIQPRRYYQESRHLSFDYLGQRNDIVDIYDLREAQGVQKRLAAIDDVLNAHIKRGDGTPLKPGDQWVKQPGEIPPTSGR